MSSERESIKKKASTHISHTIQQNLVAKGKGWVYL
jgi:hypothetical protein